MKNIIKIFAVVKSIELYSSETVPAKKRRWADSWSYAPPSFDWNIFMSSFIPSTVGMVIWKKKKSSYVSGSKVKKTSIVNQMFSLSDSCQIRFREAGSSANQVSRGWEFSQSGFLGPGFRPNALKVRTL
jgi:hypothetical protein